MILFGASGHAKVIIDILEKSGMEVDFLVDADSSVSELQSYLVKNESDYVSTKSDELIISIGSNKIRKRIAESLNAQFGWAIHPTAVLGDDVSVGQGTVMMAGTVVNSSTNIGHHSIINTNASVDHDCDLKDYVHVSPNSTLCGSVSVGEGSHIGAGATVIPNITIGKWVTIGAGAVVIKDVPDFAVVVGNPGRIIRYNDREA